MAEWSSYNGQYMTVVDLYMIQIHQNDNAWFFNCFIESNRKQKWFGGSSLEDPCATLQEAKRRALQMIKEHSKTNS